MAVWGNDGKHGTCPSHLYHEKSLRWWLILGTIWWTNLAKKNFSVFIAFTITTWLLPTHFLGLPLDWSTVASSKLTCQPLIFQAWESHGVRHEAFLLWHLMRHGGNETKILERWSLLLSKVQAVALDRAGVPHPALMIPITQERFGIWMGMQVSWGCLCFYI